MPSWKRFVPEWPDELVIELELGPRSRRYNIPLRIGPIFILEMLPEPNLARSALSAVARGSLIMKELVPPTDEPATCPLRDLQIQGQRIPDLDLPVSGRLDRVDGVFGLDFFRSYRIVEFDPRSFRLILRK